MFEVPEALARAEAELLGPGGIFETEEADVLGHRMRVFKQRPRSLRDWLLASAAFGDLEHLVFTDGTRERRITFAEHARLVRSVAQVLRQQYGVGPGDRVAILAANCPEWIVTFWATVSLGAVAVGLNGWWTGSEIRYGLGDSAPKVLVGDRKRLARLGGVIPDVPTIVIEDDYDRISSQYPDASFAEVAIDEDDAAIIFYTSGTTGRPKGAVHSHRNVATIVQLSFFNSLRMRTVSPPRDPRPPCVMVTSPLFHVSGLHAAAVSCLAGGVKSVWLTGRFDPEVALRVIEKEGVTSWGYIATLLHRMVHHPAATRHDLSSLSQLGGGGSAVPPALQKRAREAFPGVSKTLGVGYGLTECTALVSINTGEELQKFPDSVGRVMPTVEVEIRGADGAPVADGQEGEIHVRGPNVMLEYWRNPRATAEAIVAGRWLRTGDIGRRQGGRLYIASRHRDLILRGGENIYPVEIEQRLELHPDVAEAAVLGVDHEELGQEVKAIVVPASGRTVDIAALRGWASEALAYFKVPTHWEVRSAPLPRNAVGKVLKHVLRESAASTFVEE